MQTVDKRLFGASFGAARWRAPYLAIVAGLWSTATGGIAGAALQSGAPPAAPAPATVGDETHTGPSTGPSTVTPAVDSRPRVHILVDRRTEVRGYVEHEDEDTIVISWKDQTLSYPKARLSRIVRLVEPRPGQTGTVLLRDGQRQRGVVIEDGFDAVVLEIEGIRTTLDRKLVDAVYLEPTFEELVARLRSTIGEEEWQRRLELARWMIEQRRYAEAAEELRVIVERSELPDAERLLVQIEAQLALGAPSEPRATDRGRGAGDPERKRTGPLDLRDLLPQEFLTQDDVNIIRVYEMDLRNPPRVVVTPATIRTMVETYAASDLIPVGDDERNRLFREDSIRIAALLFRLKARELYPEIRVLTEPPNLNLFRQRVHNAWLVPNCATSRCHGGVDAGRFFLHSRNYKDERVRYTNLLILDRLTIDGEALIDWDDPMMSTIIQHALPRNQARFPHPAVAGWRPVFNDGNVRLLEDSLKWIREMHRPRPAYPVEFEPPVLDAPDRGAIDDDDLPVDR